MIKHAFHAWVYCLALYLSGSCNPPGARPDTGGIKAAGPVFDTAAFGRRADSVLDYSRRHKMDTTICLLADLGLHSGLLRLVAWDMQRRVPLFPALVSHGCGDATWGKDHSRAAAVCSNKADSHCSSLGHYAIGRRGYSQWGIHVNYLLHGRDSSNSNALGRKIVLHSWEAIPDAEVYPRGTPEGWGCPAVSNQVMQRLDTLLRRPKRAVLLWMYR